MVNTSSPQWKWLVVDIYRAAKRWGEYLPPPTLKYIVVLDTIKRWNNIARKDNFISYIATTITMFLGVNPLGVARKWMAIDIGSLSSQSERALNTVCCFSIYELFFFLIIFFNLLASLLCPNNSFCKFFAFSNIWLDKDWKTRIRHFGNILL